jgi:hypothetical protein
LVELSQPDPGPWIDFVWAFVLEPLGMAGPVDRPLAGHTSSIYRKLDVANRTEAVARTRQLSILP